MTPTVTTRLRRAAAAMAVLALAAGASACSTRAPADQLVLYYKAGAGDDKKFQECIEPGKAGPYPYDDEAFYLPVNLRTWNIRPSGGDTDQPIKSGSKPVGNQPGPEVVVWATADFYLNTDCAAGKDSPIVRFWEQTGRRPWLDGKGISTAGEGGFNEDAWRVMLLNTLVPAEEKALREQTRLFTADDLDANTGGVWGQIERAIGPIFLEQLRSRLGGDFFCGTGYRRGAQVEWEEHVPDGVDVNGVAKFKTEKRTGSCPPIRISITDVNFADENIAAARARVFAAEQDAKAKKVAALAELERAKILGEASRNELYLRYKEIEARAAAAEACKANPNCTVIIDGVGGVGVTTGRR
jgi:hypothetical protein